MPNKSKSDLLLELENLGYDSVSGRKNRSDRGKLRGPNSKIRCDAGAARLSQQITKTPLQIYVSLKARLLKNTIDPEHPDYVVRQDMNGIFVIMVKNNTVKEEKHSVIYHHNEIHRTVRHVQGYKTDLEKYRFEALQDIANGMPILKYPREVFAQEIDYTCAATTLELFCRLYHIKEEDYLLWTYEHWRNDYDIISDEMLSADFTFDVHHSPGTTEFMPEYAWALMEKKQKTIDEIMTSREYTVAKARVRDEIVAKYSIPIKNKLLSDEQNKNLSLSQIESLVRKSLPDEKITAEVDSRMKEWVTNKLENKEVK